MSFFQDTECCVCGGSHHIKPKTVITGSGALARLPECLLNLGAKRVFLLSDKNTHAAAGEKLCGMLKESGIGFSEYIFPKSPLPDEAAAGSAFMHFDKDCDAIVGVGSGVINDIGKILADISGKPYAIAATAPSVDGYASATSSMSRDGLKVSIPSRCADIIIGDTDILAAAPLHMISSGLGDMLAKYISICEWRISSIVTKELFCPVTADAVRRALRLCTDNADGIMRRDKDAIKALFDGLVLCGEAMEYAGCSRPASGVEHYFSHIWDIRALALGCECESHGIQCAQGTYLAAGIYDRLKNMRPDKENALRYAQSFDLPKWHEKLRTLCGSAAETMIALEEKEHKYDKGRHTERLCAICENYDEIIRIANEEVPPQSEIKKLLEKAGIPIKIPQSDAVRGILPDVFEATRDIRDKYVLSRLIWDMGLTDTVRDMLQKEEEKHPAF